LVPGAVIGFAAETAARSAPGVTKSDHPLGDDRAQGTERRLDSVCADNFRAVVGAADEQFCWLLLPGHRLVL
jgi:hypothetical protein